MLIDPHSSTHHIAWSVIWTMAVVSIILFILLLGSAVRVCRQKVHNGLVALIGSKGRALGDIHHDGQALIKGEIWSACSTHFITADKAVKVVATSGLVVHVEEETDHQGE